MFPIQGIVNITDTRIIGRQFLEYISLKYSHIVNKRSTEADSFSAAFKAVLNIIKIVRSYIPKVIGMR